ncbi:MAG: hypothetical protein ABSH08_14040 [Tepidisphaeraceae bacterium]|jgi:hypothetical protein
MKRLGRWLFNGLGALSLLLFAATTILWVRSYRIGDQWTLQNDTTKNGKSFLFAARAYCTRGSVEIVIESGMASLIASRIFDSRHSDGPAHPLIFQSFRRTLLERLGFRLAHERSSFVHGN